MEFYQNTYTDSSGNIINGATVTVFTSTGAVATIYDNAGSPQSNPFLTGLNRSEGEIEFAAADGTYDIKIENGAEVDWLHAKTLFDVEDGFAATGKIQSGYVVATKAAAESLTPEDGRKIFITSDDGGEFTMKTGAATGTYNDDSVSYCGTQFTAGDGSSGFLRDFTGPISLTWFGVTGDGVTDDSVGLSEAFATGYNIQADFSKTYISTTAQTMSVNTTLDLNGSTLKFTTTGSANNLEVVSGCNVHGGTIENAGSSFSGHGGNQCPIVIGDYGAGTGYSSIKLSSLEIITARPGGNGILITGDSNAVDVERITFPASTTMGAGVSLHWGGATTPSAGTTHPHNINISEIKGTNITSGMTTAGHALVSVSGAYNVNIENIDAYNVNRILFFYTGDYSDQYAGNALGKIGKGISVTNVNCNSITGEPIKTLCAPSVSGTTLEWPIQFDEIHLEGTALYGFQIVQNNGVSICNSSTDGFDNGIRVSRAANNGIIENTEIKNCNKSGIFLDDDVTYPDNWTIKNCRIHDNNVGTNTNPWDKAGVAARRATNVRIIDNNFGESGETQLYSARVESTTTNVVITGNSTGHLLAGGIAYSIGASTDYTINAMGHNNTAASGITMHGGAPIFYYDNAGKRKFKGTAAPASGTWAVGDTVINNAPSVDGNNMFIEGWICTVAGTPGTWVAMYISTVSPAT